MNNKKTISFRRKRKGKTDYRKRLKILLSRKPRLVIRKSVNNVTIQFIQYQESGDKVLIGVSSKELVKKGWNLSTGSCTAAYLTGVLAGKKALKKGIKEAMVDIGMQRPVPGSRIFAAVKGIIESGINIPHSEKILPKTERIQGINLRQYALKLKKESPESYQKQFSGYTKKNINMENIENVIESMKKTIHEEEK